MKWTGIAEGDRVLVSTGSGPHWGSILEGKRLDTPTPIYKVRYDEYPDEMRWIHQNDILRLHRGAGEPLNESDAQGSGNG